MVIGYQLFLQLVDFSLSVEFMLLTLRRFLCMDLSSNSTFANCLFGSWSPNMMSITSTHLKGTSYAP